MNHYTLVGRYAMFYGFGRDILGIIGIGIWILALKIVGGMMSLLTPFAIIIAIPVLLYYLRKRKFSSWEQDVEELRKRKVKQGEQYYFLEWGWIVSALMFGTLLGIMGFAVWLYGTSKEPDDTSRISEPQEQVDEENNGSDNR